MSALETVAPEALTPETAGRLIACDRLRAKLSARTCLGLQKLGTTECAGCPVGCAVRLALGAPKADALAAKEALLAEQAKRDAAARAKAEKAAAKRAARALKASAPRAACSTEGCGAFATEYPAKTPEGVGKCKRCRYAISHVRAAHAARGNRRAAKPDEPMCTHCGKRPRAKAWGSRPVPVQQQTWCSDCRTNVKRLAREKQARRAAKLPRVAA